MFEFSPEIDDFLTSVDIETAPVYSDSSQKESTSLQTYSDGLSHPITCPSISQLFVFGEESNTAQTPINLIYEGPLEGENFPLLKSNSQKSYTTDIHNSASDVIVTPEMDAFLNLSGFAQDSRSIAGQTDGATPPYIELPFPALSPSPSPSGSIVSLSSGPQFASPPESSNIQKALIKITKRGILPRTRFQYDVNTVFDYLWENIAMSENKPSQTGPGKHGVKILEHFGSLETAKEHLARSKTARKAASRKGLSSLEARRERDKRRDFFCFMPGCGLCFERADKLERHLIGTNVHRTVKPMICPHRNCDKSFVDVKTFREHAEAHKAAGHGDHLTPYPWNCPYPAVVEGLRRAFAALATPHYNDPIDV